MFVNPKNLTVKVSKFSEDYTFGGRDNEYIVDMQHDKCDVSISFQSPEHCAFKLSENPPSCKQSFTSFELQQRCLSKAVYSLLQGCHTLFVSDAKRLDELKQYHLRPSSQHKSSRNVLFLHLCLIVPTFIRS